MKCIRYDNKIINLKYVRKAEFVDSKDSRVIHLTYSDGSIQDLFFDDELSQYTPGISTYRSVREKIYIAMMNEKQTKG